MDYVSIAAAFAGGILPALAWLWFWRREDAPHPEPRRLIALAFAAGMITVALVIPVQKFVAPFLMTTTAIFTAWSVIEEVFKYLMARITVLWRRLFLLSPLAGSTFLQTLETGNLRFIGATLLHVLSSAAIGVALGLSFYKSKAAKRMYAFFGVILAILLHSAFNFLILNTPEEHLLRTFGFVWIGLIVLLAVLEYVKRIHPKVKKIFS